jgi:hypothetical protein
MLRFIIACVLIALQWPAQALAVSYITFNLGGSLKVQGSAVKGISDNGDVVGDWRDVVAFSHGFVRNAVTGRVTDFDGPVSSGFTYVTGINAAGLIVGYYSASSGYRGYVRARNGQTHDLVIPNMQSTFPTGINTSGAIAGYLIPNKTPLPNSSGFILTPAKQLIAFGKPSQYPLKPAAINDRMDVTGTYGSFGFVRLANGAIAIFSVPGGTSGQTETFPTAINSAGTVVGYAQQNVCQRSCTDTQHRGFIRYANGSIQIFTVPGSNGTFAYDVNNAGTIVGYFFVGGAKHGFMRTADGQITTFDVPGAEGFTSAMAINNNNVIAGVCLNHSSKGFIRTP